MQLLIFLLQLVYLLLRIAVVVIMLLLLLNLLVNNYLRVILMLLNLILLNEVVGFANTFAEINPRGKSLLILLKFLIGCLLLGLGWLLLLGSAGWVLWVSCCCWIGGYNLRIGKPERRNGWNSLFSRQLLLIAKDRCYSLLVDLWRLLLLLLQLLLSSVIVGSCRLRDLLSAASATSLRMTLLMFIVVYGDSLAFHVWTGSQIIAANLLSLGGSSSNTQYRLSTHKYIIAALLLWFLELVELPLLLVELLNL
jgi:hypothetical protein